MTTLPPDQHMARVNLEEGEWHDFRALSIRKKLSVAAYLGHLVQKELRRAARADRRREVRRETEGHPPPNEARDEVDPSWIPPWEV